MTPARRDRSIGVIEPGDRAPAALPPAGPAQEMSVQNMKTRLSNELLLDRMVTSSVVDALLETLQIQSSNATSEHSEDGKLLFGLVEHALGVFDLSLIPPPGANDERDYSLSFDGVAGARSGFRLAVSLEDGPQRPLFNLLRKLPSHGLVAAVRKTSADSEWLEPDPGGGSVQLAGRGLFLVMQGEAGGSVALRLSSSRDAPDDVVVLQVQPPTVLIGSTGFGLEFTHGIVLDFAGRAGPADGVTVDGVALATPADAPTWQGIAVHRARFFLPRGVPFLGAHAVDAWLQIGLSPTPGIDLIVQTQVPPQGDRPGIQVRIECRDPTATGLDGLVPTLVEAVMELPLEGRSESFGETIAFAAGAPVRARLRYARTPALAGAAPTSELSLALESQGADGLLKIDSASGGLGAKIAVTAGTLATALIADGAAQTPAPDGDGSGVVLHTLLVAAVGLSSFLEQGELVLHGAELMTTGGNIPAGKAMRLKIDYSCAATVTGIDVGALSVQMHPNQPLRVRVREVVLTIDPEKSGLEVFHLDYARSSLEVEDPGGWRVNGPGSLFDVLGTRSGRGSMWIEVDLRFKLDLGPVKVSGVTLRATLDPNGKLDGSMRGLEASLALDPMISGTGAVALTPDGFRAALDASVIPLGLGARADVETSGDMVKLALGADLPGPLPLGSSGLAIYGFGGVFAAQGRPKPVPPGADPIQAALDWDYTKAGAFVPAPAFSFGLEAVVGTAPDLGFTFSGRAGLFITTPDIVVRGSLEGHYMGPRMKIERGGNDLALLQAKGVIVVDPGDGVTIAVEGEYKIPHILVTTVPVGAHFPLQSADWFIHLGADGWTPSGGGPSESREGGPIRSVFLPDIVGQTSDAYLMMRGNGITRWPRGGPFTAGPGSFVIAFGVGFDIVYGLKPVLWADVFARADILVATHPMSFVGTGTIGGGLHIGPFSVGIDATVNVVLVDGAPPYLKADLCGSIDLFFDEIRECVTLQFGNPATPDMPPPSEHPLDGQAHSLVDDRYRRIAPLATSAEDATPASAVWPDAIPLLAFSAAPTLGVASAQFPDVGHYPEGLRARPIGSDLLRYEWELLDIALVDATAVDVRVAGSFSSAWLHGKIGDAGGQPQPAELALLTPFGDLWLHALADAGDGLATPPLPARADICHAQAAARFGWALGEAATREGDAWRLPPDPRSADPLQSQVSALVQLRFSQIAIQPGVVLNASAVQLLPLQYGYTGPRVRSFAPQVLDGRELDAWLDPGASLLPPGSNPGIGFAFGRAGPVHELRIVPDDALHRPRLWLVLDAAFWTADPAAPRVFTVSDDRGRDWRSDLHSDLGDGWVAVRWQPPAAGFVARVSVRCPAGIRMGVLALGGITRAAATAADVRNAAAAAEATKQNQAAGNGPPGAGAPASSTRRCVLAPGRLYRIDVQMRWSGTLYEVDDQGKKQVLKQKSDESLRQYWFRTAALEPGVAAPQAGTAARLAFLHHRQDRFDPAMLERHLRGYDPAQSELQRFAKDPVQVHFAPGHVALLAGAYKFDLLCGLRRLDQPATVEPDQLFTPGLAWPVTTAHLTGSEALIAQAYIASACGLAPNGVVLRIDPELTRDTWYEVFVLAKSQDAGVNDGRLPGVSFRTSRWADGSEMMTDLRFPIGGAGHADGGVALRPGAMLAPRVSHDDDGAFDEILADLGLDGWPAAAAPRASLLWLPPTAPDAGWRCAGVLLESPEPIHRTGRFQVDDLQLAMVGGAVAFDVRLRDRSGSRLLFATSAPFAPRMTRRGAGLPSVTPKLRLRCTDLPIGRAPRPLEGSIEVPLQPSFAEEAQ